MNISTDRKHVWWGVAVTAFLLAAIATAQSLIPPTSIQGGASGRFLTDGGARGQWSTASQARTLLGLGTSATRDVGTSTGTVAAGDDSRFTDSRAPSGSAGGSLAGTYPNPTIAANAVGTTQIAANAVTLAKLATQSDQTILGNVSGIAAVPSALTASQVKTMLNLGSVENTALSTWAGSTNVTTLGTIGTGTWNATTIGISKGGTGQTTASAAFNALSPITTLGDLIYGSGANTAARLAGPTSTTKQFLTSTGTGTTAAAPAWATIAAGDLPNHSAGLLTSGTVALARGGTGADLSATGGANQVVKQTSLGGAFSVAALVAGDIPSLDTSKLTTGTMATARLGSGSASSTTFLRGDQTWATPVTTPAGSDKQVQFNNGGALAGATNLVWDQTNSRLGINQASPAYAFDVAASFASPGGFQRTASVAITGTAADASSHRQALSVGAVASHTSGTLNSIRGVRVDLTGSGNGGTTSNGYGFDSNASVGTGHTLGSRFAFYISNATGAGTLTTQYGLYIESLTKGGANYAIANNGGLNYHAGNSRFGGTTDPSYAVDVTGDVNYSGAIRSGGKVVIGSYGSTAVDLSVPATQTTTEVTATGKTITLPLPSAVAPGTVFYVFQTSAYSTTLAFKRGGADVTSVQTVAGMWVCVSNGNNSWAVIWGAS